MSVVRSAAASERVSVKPSQVSVIVVGDGNETSGAVGVDTQLTEHVKAGVNESACAKGPTAAEIKTVATSNIAFFTGLSF